MNDDFFVNMAVVVDYDDDGDAASPGRPSTPERIMDGMYVCEDDDGPKDD